VPELRPVTVTKKMISAHSDRRYLPQASTEKKKRPIGSGLCGVGNSASLTGEMDGKRYSDRCDNGMKFFSLGTRFPQQRSRASLRLRFPTHTPAICTVVIRITGIFYSLLSLRSHTLLHIFFFPSADYTFCNMELPAAAGCCIAAARQRLQTGE
jgi:hypothetical protein